MTSKIISFYPIASKDAKIKTAVVADNVPVHDQTQASYNNYAWYQQVMMGSGDRINKYSEYDSMDLDVEICRALDLIAEEMIGSNPNNEEIVDLVVKELERETSFATNLPTLKACLQIWIDTYNIETQIFSIARHTIKYGDCFFIRRSSSWEFVHPRDVESAVVDENDASKILGWNIKTNMRGTSVSQNTKETRFFPEEMIIRFTLCDNMSDAMPFGESVLKSVYKAQKKKELIEDAIVIYRIQRAPEKRAFYLSAGKMSPHRQKAYLEEFKNELRTRRVPTSMGGTDSVDSVYNPMAMTEDFFFTVGPDGRGSKVEVIQGGQNLGELSDLEYFEGKVMRGLRIPLVFTKEEGYGTNDGKVGVAYIQELHFAMYIKRLQQNINQVLDREFKSFVQMVGLGVDLYGFDVKLPSPQNFGPYRELQLMQEQLNVFTSFNSDMKISQRYALSKFLQMSVEDMMENERMFCEERGIDQKQKDWIQKMYGPSAGDVDMGGIGGGGGDFDPMMPGQFSDSDLGDNLNDNNSPSGNDGSGDNSA